jgi:hypothetical protein
VKKYIANINQMVIASNVATANSFFKRLVGLLTHKELENGEALLISHCKQVHTFGMKFPIDVIFLSKDGLILYIEENMVVNKVSKYINDSYQVLELEAGIVSKYCIKLQSIIEFETL